MIDFNMSWRRGTGRTSKWKLLLVFSLFLFQIHMNITCHTRDSLICNLPTVSLLKFKNQWKSHQRFILFSEIPSNSSYFVDSFNSNCNIFIYFRLRCSRLPHVSYATDEPIKIPINVLHNKYFKGKFAK